MLLLLSSFVVTTRAAAPTPVDAATDAELPSNASIRGRALASAGCLDCCYGHSCAQGYNGLPGMCCGTVPNVGCCPMGASCVRCNVHYRCSNSAVVSHATKCSVCRDDPPPDCLFGAQPYYGAQPYHHYDHSGHVITTALTGAAIGAALGAASSGPRYSSHSTYFTPHHHTPTGYYHRYWLKAEDIARRAATSPVGFGALALGATALAALAHRARRRRPQTASSPGVQLL